MTTVPLYLITGLSGAGKSEALRTFEDMGLFCVDNLPFDLAGSFLEQIEERTEEFSGAAMVVDVRAGDFRDAYPELRATMDRDGVRARTVFVEASNERIVSRYQETRRPHPLSHDRPLDEAIDEERSILEPVREQADFVLDTTDTSIHQFRGLLRDFHYLDGEAPVTVSLTSFGFKHGVPGHVDALFDARFLPNPYYEDDLKELPGTDPAVEDFLLNHEVVRDYARQLDRLVNTMVEEYREQGRPSISLGVGCTGGQHRSCFLVNYLREQLENHDHVEVVVLHRDLTTADAPE